MNRTVPALLLAASIIASTGNSQAAIQLTSQTEAGPTMTIALARTSQQSRAANRVAAYVMLVPAVQKMRCGAC